MQTLDFCWLSDIMKGIENIQEEEKVKTKKVLEGFTAAAIAASMIRKRGKSGSLRSAETGILVSHPFIRSPPRARVI